MNRICGMCGASSEHLADGASFDAADPGNGALLARAPALPIDNVLDPLQRRRGSIAAFECRSDRREIVQKTFGHCLNKPEQIARPHPAFAGERLPVG